MAGREDPFASPGSSSSRARGEAAPDEQADRDAEAGGGSTPFDASSHIPTESGAGAVPVGPDPLPGVFGPQAGPVDGNALPGPADVGEAGGLAADAGLPGTSSTPTFDPLSRPAGSPTDPFRSGDGPLDPHDPDNYKNPENIKGSDVLDALGYEPTDGRTPDAFDGAGSSGTSLSPGQLTGDSALEAAIKGAGYKTDSSYDDTDGVTVGPGTASAAVNAPQEAKNAASFFRQGAPDSPKAQALKAAMDDIADSSGAGTAPDPAPDPPPPPPEGGGDGGEAPADEGFWSKVWKGLGGSDVAEPGFGESGYDPAAGAGDDHMAIKMWESENAEVNPNPVDDVLGGYTGADASSLGDPEFGPDYVAPESILSEEDAMDRIEDFTDHAF